MYYIFKVTKTDCSNGQYIIDKVCWNTSLYSFEENWCTKKEMVDFMLNNPTVIVKTKIRPKGYWEAGEDVRVVDNRYLRTDANGYKADNLGSLVK